MDSNMLTFLVVVCVFFTIGWIVTIGWSNWRRGRTAKLQADLHSRLLDKCGTSQELLEYLKSDAGSRFLDSATIERGTPMGRVLGSMQAGVILLVLGIGLIIIRMTLPHDAFWSQMERAQTAQGFVAFGVMLLALGIGFLASAMASYRLSKNWGLLEPESNQRR